MKRAAKRQVLLVVTLANRRTEQQLRTKSTAWKEKSVNDYRN